MELNLKVRKRKIIYVKKDKDRIEEVRRNGQYQILIESHFLYTESRAISLVFTGDDGIIYFPKKI